MAKHMTKEEATKAAEQLLKMFEKIDRECFKREQDTITTINIETGEIIR